ncbi:substrate-binding domain-containing protein [Desulfosporosinus sp. BICA1-9]|uniref:substrate-binding domain-containing protein n=1 Tax=Desulfosporosinus sp. BICA1-9 TaxID=1531958 RepID=UPI00054B8A92|nr:substrate-binding domain-containing protein [Desulfosporosinus sp. BICA1-9]KJS50583.1 MAG: hypothetical protein VR66_02215 [Peptococcaceae bacterium BRH_c23]KJS82850.1 MAG: hypothetical protein JL57_23860 [Desulfosporosinus sp. BICA1-9]
MVFKRRWNLLILVFLIIACLNGCTSNKKQDVIIKEDILKPSEVNATDQYNKESKNVEEYVGIYALGSYEYFTDHKIGLMKAGEALNVKIEYMGPPDNNIDEMIKCFDYAISKKVAGIVVFGANDRLAAMIDKAADCGIPSVTVDGDIKNSQRIAFVGTGNYNAGYLGGNTLAKILNGKGQVAILTEPEVELHRERTSGYTDALGKTAGIKIVEIADTKANHEDAHKAALDILNKYPELDAIACTDYFGGIAASVALEEVNKQGKVKILAMDRSQYVLKKIEDGVITATLVQQTALMPFYAMQILYNYNHNLVPIVPNTKDAGITGTPVYIDTGVFIIDMKNYKSFMRN